MPRKVKFSDKVIEHIIERSDPPSDSLEENVMIAKKRKIGEDLDTEDALIKQLGERHLGLEEIEGQEDATVRGYGDITVTPFNLKEECEDGYFDRSGNFIFDKTAGDSRDPWLDSIQWDKIKEIEPEDSEMSSEQTETINKMEIIQNILSILDPDETILMALKRLNRQRTGIKSSLRSAESKTSIFLKINNLTGWADVLMEQGDGEIYHKTGNDLRKEIKDTTASPKEWYYRWSEDSEIYGPFTTDIMIAWENAGYFKPYVFCKCQGVFDDQFFKSDTFSFKIFLHINLPYFIKMKCFSIFK